MVVEHVELRNMYIDLTSQPTLLILTIGVFQQTYTRDVRWNISVRRNGRANCGISIDRLIFGHANPGVCIGEQKVGWLILLALQSSGQKLLLVVPQHFCWQPKV